MECIKFRELPDVLRCRPRVRDALGGPVTESAAFSRLVLLSGGFEHRFPHEAAAISRTLGGVKQLPPGPIPYQSTLFF